MSEAELNEQNTRALDRIEEVLEGVRDKVSDLGVSSAVLSEQVRQVNVNLTKLNGKVATHEGEIARLKEIVSELRGAWKLASAASGVIGFGASWAMNHWGPK